MKNKRNIWKRLLKKKTAVVFLLLLGLIVLAVLLAPWIAPNDIFKQDLLMKFAPPSKQYPFGTDDLGRCIFSRLLYGGRATLGYALVATMVSAVIGTTIGMTAAYFGGKIDNLIMRLCDIMYAFPSLVITLVIVAILGAGMNKILVAMIITQWLYYARMSRGMALAVKCREFIPIAKINGASDVQIIFRYLFPNILPQMIAVMTIDFGHTLLAISGLSFLGLGVQPPSPEWGMMINDGRNFINRNAGIMIWPGIMILMVVLSVNVIGDYLRDVVEEERS